MKSYKKYFWDVITKQYADFKGVATRKQYWMFQLFTFISYFLIMFSLALIYGLLKFLGFKFFGMVLVVLVVLLVFVNVIPSLAMSVRRLHDIKMSGWVLLIDLIPYAGGLILFVFFLLPSETENNKYITQK